MSDLKLPSIIITFFKGHLQGETETRGHSIKAFHFQNVLKNGQSIIPDASTAVPSTITICNRQQAETTYNPEVSICHVSEPMTITDNNKQLEDRKPLEQTSIFISFIRLSTVVSEHLLWVSFCVCKW